MPLTRHQVGYNEAVSVRSTHPDASADDIRGVMDKMQKIVAVVQSVAGENDDLALLLKGSIEAHEDMLRVI
jgi:hypothetical protein